MNSPIRVVVWGTGNIGQAVLKLAARRDDLAVVGVLVYSDHKNGCDIGEIAGIGAQGVAATTDREAIFALMPDCIVYTVQDIGDFRSDSDVKEFLRRGINVVTSLPYQNVDVRGAEIADELQRAGEAGLASLYGAGINPGFMPERLAMTLTGLTSEISEILIEEFYRIGNEPEPTLTAFGFGLPAPEKGERPPAVALVEQLERQFIYYIGDHLGTPVTELRYSADWHLADKMIETSHMTVQPGTAAYITHRWEGVTAPGGPSIKFHAHWYMSDELAPNDLPCEDYYRITIEGLPSVRVGLELRASAFENRRMYDGDSTEPVYYATAATLLQAIPVAIEAAPGIAKIAPPSNTHWHKILSTATN